MSRITFLATVLCATLLPAASDARPRRGPGRPLRLTASAYCHHGTTRSGAQTSRGTLAADPRVLPVGTVVRIESTVPGFSGNYIVRDTGAKIKGRKVDIFVPNCANARAFGKRVVVVRVLRSI